jgi:hypothetical protein
VLQALKTAPRRVSIRVGIKTSGAPRRGGDEYDRASSLPTGPPRESAGEPFLQVVRRSADERRATRHAPGAPPRPGRSRLALQAGPCGQGAGGGRGGPGHRSRPVLGYNAGSGQKSGRCLPSETLAQPRAVISSARAWKRSSSGHGRIPTAGLSRAERYDRSSPRGRPVGEGNTPSPYP